MNATAESFMRQALEEADLAAAAGEVPVGAVIVHQGTVIARAHNEVETLQNATAHAESLAIQRASNALGSWRLNECALYVTMEPCPMCIGAILLSRIDEVYFGCWDPVMGATGSVFNLAQHSQLPRQVKLYPEVLRHECEQVLTTFFAARREK